MFNPEIVNLNAPPVSIVLNWKSSYDNRHGPLIDMSQAVPGYTAHDDMLTALAKTAGNPEFARYGPVEGDITLRQAYAEHVSDFYAAQIGADQIQITSGCNQAFVATALAVAGRGDRILMLRPCYFNHASALGMLGIGIDYVDCDKNLLPDYDTIATAINTDTRALTLVSPNNPAGSIYPKDLLLDIFELCRARKIWLILDETYRDFLPLDQDTPHHLFAQDNWQNTLVQLYSFSKSYCLPGHRLGAITAGNDLIFQLTKIIDNIQICAPRAVQHAIAPMIKKLSHWRQNNRRIIAARAEIFHGVLAQLCGWQLLSSGAYFGFVRHPFEGLSSVDVAKQLAREAGVLVIPGAFFGSGQDAVLRFAFANADQKVIAKLPERLKQLKL